MSWFEYTLITFKHVLNLFKPPKVHSLNNFLKDEMFITFGRGRGPILWNFEMLCTLKGIYEKYSQQNWHDIEQSYVMNLIYNLSHRCYICI
jgi:hypothetical protein